LFGFIYTETYGKQTQCKLNFAETLIRQNTVKSYIKVAFLQYFKKENTTIAGGNFVSACIHRKRFSYLAMKCGIKVYHDKCSSQQELRFSYN